MICEYWPKAFASFCCEIWNEEIGRSNWIRVPVYSIAESRASRAAPVTPKTMPKRASDRHESGALRPLASGSIASSGRRTLSRTISPVIEARREILRWISGVCTPSVSDGTTKPRMTGRPLSSVSSVFAHTTMTSETGEFVIHIFEPLRIQSEPSLRAVVFMPEGSEPTSGSVSPKQPSALPAAIFGSHSSFCASEP
ncbi:Uncharacterised protein [Mycobacteroides abscessus subsp. abscessus]|nr:Uncharacterised protein [Mycobacteroides abscessus subsp. abscessus]